MNPAKIRGARQWRVLVIEDHPLVREGLVHLINQQSDLVICGEGAQAEQVVPLIRAQQPDLLVLDVRLKGGDAMGCIQPAMRERPTLRILVLSQFDERVYAERVLQAGAHGYIMKEQASREILNAIRSVLAGGLYLSRRMGLRLLRRFQGIAVRPLPVDAGPQLSRREMEVLQMLGAGMNTREIATDLQLSAKTVETYRDHLGQKLGLAGAAELVRYATVLVEEDGPLPIATVHPPELTLTQRL